MQAFTTRTFLVGAAILLLGVLGTIGLIALRPEAPRSEPEAFVPAVNTVLPDIRNDAVPVTGTGTVRPVNEVALVAEVAGRIVYVSPAFASGGRFGQDEVLVRIDPADYANAVEVARAEVVQRRVDSLVAAEEAGIAREEWNRVRALTDDSSGTPVTPLGSLVLREPQQQLAAAALRAAEARLSDALTRLDRTEVKAPFRGVVRAEQAEVGQVVAPGTLLGTVYATHALELTVSLQARDTELLAGLWSAGRGGTTIPARVLVDFGSRTHAWEGRVARVEGALDPATRTVGAVIRVDDPSRPDQGDGPPLLPGMFARAELQARLAGTYAAIPSEALREDDTVWVVEDDRLRIRPVDVLYRLDGDVLLRNGLDAGDRIVVSNLLVVSDGMAVRDADAASGAQ